MNREKENATMEQWKCSFCNYIYMGELPDGLLCPRCRQVAAIFEKIKVDEEEAKANERHFRYYTFQAGLARG